MNLTISKRMMRWLTPETEKNRQEFRMCLSKSMANAEDIARTVKLMNGHLKDRLVGLKTKDK